MSRVYEAVAQMARAGLFVSIVLAIVYCLPVLTWMLGHGQ